MKRPPIVVLEKVGTKARSVKQETGFGAPRTEKKRINAPGSAPGRLRPAAHGRLAEAAAFPDHRNILRHPRGTPERRPRPHAKTARCAMPGHACPPRRRGRYRPGGTRNAPRPPAEAAAHGHRRLRPLPGRRFSFRTPDSRAATGPLPAHCVLPPADAVPDHVRHGKQTPFPPRTRGSDRDWRNRRDMPEVPAPREVPTRQTPLVRYRRRGRAALSLRRPVMFPQSEMFRAAVPGTSEPRRCPKRRFRPARGFRGRVFRNRASFRRQRRFRPRCARP